MLAPATPQSSWLESFLALFFFPTHTLLAWLPINNSICAKPTNV